MIKKQSLDQLEYSKVIGSLIDAMTYMRLYIAFVVAKLSRLTSNASLESGYLSLKILEGYYGSWYHL